MSQTDQEVLEELEWALKNGDLQQVTAILSKNKELANAPFPSGRHPLVVTADYGHAEVIDYLLKNGANVNVTDKYGITPLLAAIYENHCECAKLLIEKGANKSQSTPDGMSYLDNAETEEMKTILR